MENGERENDYLPRWIRILRAPWFFVTVACHWRRWYHDPWLQTISIAWCLTACNICRDEYDGE